MAGAAAATAGAATGAAIPAAGDATAAAGAESVDFIIEHWFHPILFESFDSFASAFPFQGVSVFPMAEEQQLQARRQEQQQQEQLNEMRNLAA